MCGIIAYIGGREAVPILVEGLKRLEYRGYDSAGVCVSNKGELQSAKRKGRISELEQSGELKKLSGTVGIAHTRWATHGEPSTLNAHPHSDDKIAVVHNGIIENNSSLKKLLAKEGYAFKTDTDTEVLVYLIRKFYKDDLENAVVEALKLVEGAYGIAVLSADGKKIIAARKGSPLVVGVGKKEMFVASDVPAILKHTKDVVYLQDGDVATIEKDSYVVKNIDGIKITRDIQKIKWSIDQIEKAGYKHFMLKEIFEQPKAIASTLRGRIKDGKIKLTLDFDVNKVRRIVIAACGTSWHSALIGKHLFERLTRIPVEVDYASEFRYRKPIVNETDLFIVISQSGETADTLAALREAKRGKAKTLGIINVVGSTISREVGSGLYLHAGPEIGVASTKAFTCQVVALLLLTLYLKQERGESLDAALLNELEELPGHVDTVLSSSEKILHIAKHYVNSKNFLYLGRGVSFPVALEGALKLKEISYIHAEGYPAAEMKHGPIALVDKDMPVVFIATKDGAFDKVVSNMEEVKARNGRIIAVVNEKDSEISRLTENSLIVPKARWELCSVLNVIPLQLLAYYIADMKGIDVDKPRNLAKSVTVE